MSDPISILNKLSTIPHNVFLMDHNERVIHLDKIREHLDQIKKELSKSNKENIDINFLNRPIPAFMLAYYGLSVKDIVQGYVDLYKNAFADFINKINIKYSCKNSYNKPYKKILFCSGRLSSYSSVYRSTHGIIEHLAKLPDFHVEILTRYPLHEDVKKSYSNCKNIFAMGNIHNNIDVVGAGRYDAVIYPDLNMDDVCSPIGLLRLSPHQITTFGHSETSGMADYFVTSDSYEVNAKNNYTEKVVSFKSLALKYKNLDLGDVDKYKSRAYFQISEKNNIYYCNSSCFKMGKEMFHIIKGILEKDKNAVVVLTKLNIANWDVVFFETLDKIFPIEYLNRIKILQRLNSFENSNLLSISDVFIESYPFGNMNSTLECFAAGLPVVSIPTTKINGRFTHAYYSKMGLEKEYCVSNIEDYINKAVEIANCKDKNKREEIKEKSKVLFEEEQSVVDWENFIRGLK